MNDDEFYEEEAHYAMQEEQAYEEALQEAYQDVYFEGKIVTNIKLALTTSENWEHYESLVNLMKDKSFLTLSLGLNDGLPYYQTKLHGIQRNIYITKEIRRQIYNYLRNGIVPDKMPEVYEVYNNVDETFILHHLKTDKKNNATIYNTETKEYKAKYQRGTINYGKLPYTTEELVTKLNSL